MNVKGADGAHIRVVQGESGMGILPMSEDSTPFHGRDARATPASKSRLWLWFVAAFLFQVAAWTTWFVIASHHPVQEVPLATRENPR